VDTTKLKKPSERVALRREVSVHYTLKHRNVVEVLEVFERSGYIFIVMELLEGGDLFNHIVEHGKLEEDRARAIFVQMLNAIWYCHANSVVHRDLKLENFLIDKEGK
jgi:5'-AMP-activated protein kinase catalytic alpha subunit